MKTQDMSHGSFGLETGISLVLTITSRNIASVEFPLE